MRTLMWKLIGVVALICGIVSMLGSIVLPWLYSMAPIMVTGAELHRIQETGLPSSPERIRWSPWSDCPEDLQPSDWVPGLDPDARIVEYRTGTASAWHVRLTFYQAKYVQSDGRTLIGHAVGPEPLIKTRRETCWGTFFAGVSLTVGFFLLAHTVEQKLWNTRRDDAALN